MSVREETLPKLKATQVLVATLFSAISPGTERRLYFAGRVSRRNGHRREHRGSLCRRSPVLALKYGYAAVGQVVAMGKDVGADWEGSLVVAFHPHS